MDNLTGKRPIEITFLRGAGKRYRAYVAMVSADSMVIGRDALHGKGTTDLFTSWQRFMLKTESWGAFFTLVPVTRPGLDMKTDETHAAWLDRVRKTLPTDQTAAPCRPPWEQAPAKEANA